MGFKNTSHIKRKLLLDMCYKKALNLPNVNDELSVTEYSDSEDFVTGNLYEYLLNQFVDYSIGEFFNITSEEYIRLPTYMKLAYMNSARRKMKQEQDKLDAIPELLENEEKEKNKV